jgi:2-oxoisovalerate dehydrogenase E2 component (dihydrolipoyl transacylase)
MFLRGIRHSPRLIARFQTRWASNKVVHTFKLADIGEGITECEVIRWSVSPRATITAFDPLCEVQSDKASVEITSPFDGVVKELLVQEGQVAKVGQGLCTIEVEEEAVEGVEKASGTEEPPKPAPRTEEPKETLVTSEPEAAPSPRRRHPLDPSFKPEKGSESNNSLATPSVRHFARTQGVDLALLAPGSGKGGRVEKADVEAYLSGSSRTSTPPPAPTQCGEDIVVELGRTRHAMYRAMVKVFISYLPKHLLTTLPHRASKFRCSGTPRRSTSLTSTLSFPS